MSLKTVTDIAKILQPVQSSLLHVDTKMKLVDSSLFAPLADAFVDLIGSGGKRLRPALALMAAGVSGTPGAPLEELADDRYGHVISLAASVEMLHTATLVHDDVIDGALLRRGAPTLNAVWNRGATVLAGNFMFARAAQFAAETGNMRVIHIFSDTLDTIVDGELRQLSARYNFQQPKDEYYQRIFAKTASLFQAATEAAAVLAELPSASVQALRAYGYHLGMAFQIVDDILDFTGDTDSLGKPAGSDLRQGILTLPFFYFLHAQGDQGLPTDERVADLVTQLEQASDDGADEESEPWRRLVDQVVIELRDSPAVEAARAEALRFLELAQADLSILPDTVYKVSMMDLCDFVVQRTY